MSNIEEIKLDSELQQMMDTELKVKSIFYPGIYQYEQVEITVCHDCYLSDYMLIKVARNAEDLPDYSLCRVLTFDDIELSAGDKVCVMTCRGEDKEAQTPDGKKEHTIFWNLNDPIWKDGENEIMIMKRGDSTSYYIKSSTKGN